MNKWFVLLMLALAVVSAIVLYMVLQTPPNVASDASALLGR